MTFWEVGIRVRYEGEFYRKYFKTLKGAKEYLDHLREEYSDEAYDDYWAYCEPLGFEEDK